MEIIYDNVFVRPQNLRVGQSVLSHKHQESHLHPSRRGAQLVEMLEPTAWEPGTDIPTEFRVLKAVEIHAWQDFARALIPKNTWHRITAIPPKAHIEPEMLAAGRAVAPNLPEAVLLGIYKAMAEADPVSLSDCIYAHRVPQLLIQNAGKDARYDELLTELCALAEEKFGDVVQEWGGWLAATQ